MSTLQRVSARDVTAARLLRSSQRSSFTPDREVDWAAPFEDGLPFMPPEKISLYGTPLWRELDEQRRIVLSKHELASQMAVGIWLELSLMHGFLRALYDQDPRTAHAQFALTEVGDETRHSIMFGKLIDKLGTPRYGVPRPVHAGGRLFNALGGGPSMWAVFLLGEEVFDRMQRAGMADERVQPLVRTLNRIHVIEEARHVRYAKEDLVRNVRGLSRGALERHRLITAVVGTAIVDFMIDPSVYRCVGITPVAGRRMALANPYFRETRSWTGEKIMPFLDEVGLLSGPGVALWRRIGMI
ncbi:AurF N-oxygenase family protein [Actinomadura nitritigenes]|uniref:AurF N-oxygenase family protein n=1 Tax=Actinomadura nitritigenes TaxID=134602 RepID=UPI003D905816